MELIGKDTSIILGECLKEMMKLPEHQVDLIAADLPYGVSKNRWDHVIPLAPMWEAFGHVLKKNGRVVLTATQPFSSQLVMSNPKDFKYDLIWEKPLSSGQLNVSKMPLRSHEHILVFYKKFCVYNEQTTEGSVYNMHRKADYKPGSYGVQKASSKINTGYRHARSVVKIINPRIKGGHPSQKPLALMDYIVKTFSNEGDLVLDCSMGYGTTGVACVLNKRKFIGIDNDEYWFNAAKSRLQRLQEAF